MRRNNWFIWTGVVSLVTAWSGNVPSGFHHPGPDTTTTTTTTTPPLPAKKMYDPGVWLNCQSFCLHEGVLEDERPSHTAMPQIQLTAENVCSYRINGPDGFFGLRESTLDTGAKAARITLLKKLDREVQKLHKVSITAVDCDGDAVDSREITINVCDINDHAPWFDPGSLIMEMCPDAKVGDTVGTLSASDADFGIYAKLEYRFTYRKPHGHSMHVTHRDGRKSTAPSIFMMNAATGEITVIAEGAFNLLHDAKFVTQEVSVRDHPGNEIFGARNAQVIIKMCNRAPEVKHCNLGVVQESTPIGTLTTGQNVHIVDDDYDYRDKEVGYTILYAEGGALEIELSRENGVTTASAVRILEAFDFETVQGVTLQEDQKVVTIPVEFSNPQSNHPKPSVFQCQITIVNVNEKPLWATAQSRRTGISFAEHCETEIGRCYDEFIATDPDDLDIVTYSTLSEFFSVSKLANGHASVCLQHTFDREEHCIIENGNAYIPVVVRATKPKYGLYSEKEYQFKCDDINDNKPSIIFSPQPHADMICTELGRNFSDTKFLKDHDVDLNEVDFSIDWDDSDVDIVAIALIQDLDDGTYGNAYGFDVQSLTEDFEARATDNPYIYLVVHVGDRDYLEDGEEIVLTVADAGSQEITKHECLAELGPQYLSDHNGNPVKFILRACECSANEDYEYYPIDECAGLLLGALAWWLFLLLLLLLLLLALCLYCCRDTLCPPVIVAGEKEDQLIYKYDKPDWYYYLYNIVKPNEKTTLLVDNAAVDHPQDVSALLIKTKKEADQVHRTQDDQKVFIDEFGNRSSFASTTAPSTISVTSVKTTLDSRPTIQWPSKLDTIPDNDEYETFENRNNLLYNKTYVEPTDDQMSDISNMTVYQKSYEFLDTTAGAKYITRNDRTFITHTETNTLQHRGQYSNAMDNNLIDMLSRQNVTNSVHRAPSFASRGQIDKLHRSTTPSAKHRINTIDDSQAIIHQTSNELNRTELNADYTNNFDGTLRLNRSGDSTKPYSANTSSSTDPDQPHVATMRSAEYKTNFSDNNEKVVFDRKHVLRSDFHEDTGTISPGSSSGATSRSGGATQV